MIITVALASLTLLSGADHRQSCDGDAVTHVAVADTLRGFYEGGAAYGDFMAAARQRVEQWRDNYARGGEVLDPLVIERAKRVGGTWYLLVVAVDGCADSVNTVPYLAALTDRVESIGMRIVLPDAGRPLQETRRTPDGRTATPTIIVLDADWKEIGAIVERPAPLLAATAAWEAEGERNIRGRRMEWYESDAGRSTVAEVLEIIERAGRR